MQTLKPTWAIAKAISRRHTIVATKITLLAVLLCLGLLTLVFLWLGENLTLSLYGHFISKYSGPITSLILFIHMVPANWYAIIRVFDNKFKDFRVEIFPPLDDGNPAPRSLQVEKSDISPSTSEI